jgi:hypothetical protein
MNNIENAVSRNTDREENVRAALLELYDSESQNKDYAAMAISAADVGVRLFNIIYAARNPNSGGTLKALLDLTVGLSGNLFWTKYGAGLMPLLHTSLQAQSDYAILALEKANNPTLTAHDDVRAESRLVALEMFVSIAYVLGGMEYMAIKSLEIKKRMAAFLTE